MTEKQRKIFTINLIILLILNITYGFTGILSSFGIIKEWVMYLSLYATMIYNFIVIIQILRFL
jgi:hypothetical protein